MKQSNVNFPLLGFNDKKLRKFINKNDDTFNKKMYGIDLSIVKHGRTISIINTSSRKYLFSLVDKYNMIKSIFYDGQNLFSSMVNSEYTTRRRISFVNREEISSIVKKINNGYYNMILSNTKLTKEQVMDKLNFYWLTKGDLW